MWQNYFQDYYYFRKEKDSISRRSSTPDKASLKLRIAYLQIVPSLIEVLKDLPNTDLINSTDNSTERKEGKNSISIQDRSIECLMSDTEEK